ncbi:MAG: TolC family protein [Bdellovibrionaceae bacterium]|nr:TolC family protein [Pseudobdellovibrionaceae bacterium]NUM58171.1 TolC family protein [Pseudobdellovibrionaceae bacterium]
MVFFRVILFASIYFISFKVFGIEVLTLEGALKEANQNSLLVQKAQASMEEMKWKKRETSSGYLPVFTAGLNYLTDKKYMLLDTTLGGNNLTIPQVVPTTQYTLRATLPLFDGLVNIKRYQAGALLEEASSKDLEWTVFSIHRQTILQFYKSLSTQVLSEVAEQNLKTLQDHLKDIKAFKKVGVSTNYDVLRVEVQVSEASSEWLNSQDNVEIAKYKLGEILGKEQEIRLLNGKLPILNESIINHIDQNILEKRTDILALKLKTQAQEKNYEGLSRYWIPRISIFGEAQYYNNKNDRFDDSESFRNGYLVGLNLSWNIFDGMNSISRSAQAEQQVIQTQKTLKMTEIKAKQDFEFWKRKFKYFCSVYKSRSNDVIRSEEAVRLAKEGRKAGLRTSTDLLDAESDLFRSRAGQVTAQIGAIEALINLELVSGQKIYDFN